MSEMGVSAAGGAFEAVVRTIGVRAAKVWF